MPRPRHHSGALVALAAAACVHAPPAAEPIQPTLRDRFPGAIARYAPPPSPSTAISWRADRPESARDSLVWQRWVGTGWLPRQVAQLGTRWRLPGGIVVQLSRCRPWRDRRSASWSREEMRILVCYEFASELLAMAQSAQLPPRAGGAPDAMTLADYRDQLLAGMEGFALHHEVGHMLAGMLGLPITGREEDFADQFALLQLLADSGAAPAQLDGPLWHFGFRRVTTSHRPDDPHASPAQRMANWACWLVGSDRFSSAHLEEWAGLSEYRRSRCHAEFVLLRRAIGTITAPYRR
ncbi:MAG: hypothetical protein IPJ56_02470 [Gemmatimonadetes bacterium]|nr:hypothetical protein [Gemmatimonadota bacterium]